MALIVGSSLDGLTFFSLSASSVQTANMPVDVQEAGFLSVGGYSGTYNYGWESLSLNEEDPNRFAIRYRRKSGGVNYNSFFAFALAISNAASRDSMCFSFKMRDFPTMTSSEAVAGFLSDTAPVVGARFSTDGLLRALTPDGLSDSVDINAYWNPGELNIVNIHWSKPSKKVSVFVNDVSVMEVVYAAEGSTSSVSMGGFCTVGANNAWGVDFYQPLVTDTNPGFYRFLKLFPSADVESDFTPDVGDTSYSRINESPPDGDASYVSATNPGATAVFRYADSDGNPLELGPNQDVLTVKHLVQARNDFPDTRFLKSVYRKDGINTPTESGVEVTGAYRTSFEKIEINPATGVAWQREDFENWAFGFMLEEDE